MIARAWGSQPDWSSSAVGLVSAVALGLVLGALSVFISPLSVAASLIGAAALLVILRDPGFGLYGLLGVAFLLPFAVLPARLGVQLTALEAALGLTALAVLLRGLAKRTWSAPEPVLLAVAVLVGLAAFSSLLNLPHVGGGMDVWRRLGKLLLAMLVFPLTLHLAREAKRVDRLVLAFMVLGAMEAILGILLHWLPRDTTVRVLSSLSPLGYPSGSEVLRFLPGENDTYTDVARATATSIDPNVLGGVLMLAGAMLLTQLFAPRPLLPRWALLPLGSAVVFSMLLSHSRSSWVGLAVAALIIATLRFRKLWLGVIPVAAAVGLLPAGRALLGRVVSGFSAQDKAAAMRVEEHRNAVEIIQQYPLFGIGFGGPPSIDLAPGVSSLYLTVAQTSGLPALVVLLGVLVCILGRALSELRSRNHDCRESTSVALTAAVLAALVAGLFDHYFASTAFPHMVALFWLCCGLLWSNLNCPDEAVGYQLSADSSEADA